MVEKYSKEEIKELIKSGFSLQLISFELDIPTKRLEQYQREIELSKRLKYNQGNIQDRNIPIKSNQKNHTDLKMRQMREKYQKLYLQSDSVEEKTMKELSEKEIECINSVIKVIEKAIEEMKDCSKKERRKVARNILLEIKKIEKYPLTIEQAEKLIFLLRAEELKEINIDVNDKTEASINRARKRNIIKLAEAIDIAQAQEERLEELEKLKRTITIDLIKEEPNFIRLVESRIRNKILKMQQQKIKERIRNEIPSRVIMIIVALTNGTLDIKEANIIIEEEAKKRVESKPKNKFSLAEEQEKRQILSQIKTAIIERAERYPINNPEKTIQQVQELCGGELGQALRTVVKNLVARKDFETAKEICDRFYKQNKENQSAKYIKILRSEIRKEEIADMVLKGINMRGTPEQESAYFDLIEKGLQKSKIKLSSVYLGKSKDGTKNISLADIWTGKQLEDESRYLR